MIGRNVAVINFDSSFMDRRGCKWYLYVYVCVCVEVSFVCFGEDTLLSVSITRPHSGAGNNLPKFSRRKIRTKYKLPLCIELVGVFAFRAVELKEWRKRIREFRESRINTKRSQRIHSRFAVLAPSSCLSGDNPLRSDCLGYPISTCSTYRVYALWLTRCVHRQKYLLKITINLAEKRQNFRVNRKLTHSDRTFLMSQILLEYPVLSATL